MQLHPGLSTALKRFDFDETQLARAMAAGELPSPQEYGNSWYFRIRLSGTGLSYRPQLNEYVERLPEHYLAPDKPDLPSFAARCNGLPVIWAHPPKMKLDTDEYIKRNVGTVVLPYVGDESGEDPESDEVWGIARILDQEAAKLMRDKELSTSPAVELPPGDSGKKIDAGDGRHLLIENRPKVVDHVAIVPEGVWDKMGRAGRGVDDGKLSTTSEEAGSTAGDERGVSDMAEEKTKEELEREADRKGDRRRGDDRRDDEGFSQVKKEEPDDDLGGIKAVLADGFKKIHDRMDTMDKRMDKYDDDRRHDTESAAKEKEQSETLERLAKEEEEEAHSLEEKETADKKDSLRRRADESDDDYSERVHDAACRHDGKHFRRRDDESRKAHADRCDAAVSKILGIKRRGDESEEEEKKEEREAAADKRGDRRRDDGHKDDGHKDDDRRDDDRRRADAARDADFELLKRTVARQAVEIVALKQEPSDEDRHALAEIQSRADTVLMMHNDRAPAPMQREGTGSYRVRMARKLQSFSQKWKGEDLDKMFRVSPSAFEHIEGEIYADATTSAKDPMITEEGSLVAVPIPNSTGHKVTEYRGDPLGWMGRFMHTGACAKRFGLPQ